MSYASSCIIDVFGRVLIIFIGRELCGHANVYGIVTYGVYTLLLLFFPFLPCLRPKVNYNSMRVTGATRENTNIARFASSPKANYTRDRGPVSVKRVLLFKPAPGHRAESHLYPYDRSGRNTKREV